MQLKKIAFVDVETTGTSAQFDRIIEIAVVRVENKKVVKTFNTLIDPERIVHGAIERLTGIRQQDLDRAPSFYDISEELLEILEGCTFIAHNVRFDYGFIRSEFKRLGIAFSSPHACTVKLSRRLYPHEMRHNLDAVIERHGIKCANRHRALDDAQVLWEFYRQVVKQFGAQTIEESLGEISKRTSLPIHIPVEQLKALPRGAGVYIFYGENGMPLYVGKSVNIRARVQSHFGADLGSQKEMKIAQQIRSIETIETKGELGALLTEAELVKKIQPLYNRQLRHAHKLLVLRCAKNEEGYIRATLDQADTIAADDFDSVIATFKGKRQAEDILREVSKEHLLCNKLLGVEHATASCFGYNLHQCKGACLGEESPAIYNVRFENAFARLRFKKWPYQNPILIREGSEERGFEGFLVDKWCFLGTVKWAQGAPDITLRKEPKFDLDTYKILRAFLRKPGAGKSIQAMRFEGVAKAGELLYTS